MKNPNEEKKKRSLWGDGADKDGWKRDEQRNIEEGILSKATKAGKEQNENDSFKSGETERKEKRGLSFY